MIQAKAVHSQADAHRQELMAGAGSRRDVRRPVAAMTRLRSDAALGHRTPGCRWPSSAPGCGTAGRFLADRVRDQARRGVGPHVVSLRPGAAPCTRSPPLGSASSARVGHAAVPQRALHHPRPVARRLPLGARPSGGGDADARRTRCPGRPLRQPLGQRGAVRPVAGVPVHRHLSAPQPLHPERDARSTPASPTWRCWRGSWATTPSSSGTPTPRSTRARCRRAIRGSSATRGSCRDSGSCSRIPGSRGARHGDAGWPRRASTSRPTPTISTSPSRGFPARTRTGRPGRPTRFPVELSQTTFVRQEVVDWLEQQRRPAVLLHASFIRPHPPRRNPMGYHDLYPADAVGPFAGCPTPEEEAGIHPLAALAMGIPGVGAPRDERERRQVRATYYGAQREVDDGLAPLFEYLRATAGWPSPPWSSSPATTARWAVTIGCWRSWGTGTRAITSRSSWWTPARRPTAAGARCSGR